MTLADKIEALTGPDRQHFVEAWEAVRTSFWQSEWDRFSLLLELGAWEQAAMMLVPEDAEEVGVSQYKNGRGSAMIVPKGCRGPSSVVYNAATPALALCAAALRATQPTSASGCVG